MIHPVIDPAYDHDGVTLYAGDCLGVMPFLREPVDMVLADLPYGTTRNDWDRELPNKLLWANYHGLVRPAAAMVMFASGGFGARLIVENLAEYRYSLVWQKNTVSGHLNAKRMPLRSHEDVHVFYRRLPTYHPQMVHTGRASHARGRRRDRTVNHYGSFENTEVVDQGGEQYPRSVLTFDRPKDGFHPTQKPLDLCRWLIRTYTDPGDVVLDNVCGSGTTLLAARAEGRRAIGIEVHPPYVETAIRRLSAA